MYVQFDKQKLQSSPEVILVYVVKAELLQKFSRCARKYIAFTAVRLQGLGFLIRQLGGVDINSAAKDFEVLRAMKALQHQQCVVCLSTSTLQTVHGNLEARNQGVQNCYLQSVTRSSSSQHDSC